MKKLTVSQKNKLVKDGFTLVDDSLTLGQFKARIDGGQVHLYYGDYSAPCIIHSSRFAPGSFVDLIAYKLVDDTDQASAGEENPDYVDEEILEHPLYPIFVAAIHQAIYGKGERHGGGKTPFMDQSWLFRANKHGNGFLTGQSSKKLDEAAETRAGEAFDAEVLGAIVYAGMSIIHRRMTEDKEAE